MMRIEDFSVYFKKQKKIVKSRLLKLIREKTSYCGDLRPLLRDLMDLVFEEAYYKVLEGGLSDLPVPVIIMIKTNDVFCDTFRIPKKKPRMVEMSPDVAAKASSELDPYQQMVRQEDMKTVDSLFKDAQERQMFEGIADQRDSCDIAADLQITLTALTSRISRARERIQKHLTKGY